MSARSTEAASPPAVLFDLDGVVSDTAAVHAKAWKRAFDDARESLRLPGRPFDEHGDYREFVDGKTREVGIADYLASLGVSIPLGGSEDRTPVSIRGIGNHKNGIFRVLLEQDGVRIFPDARTILADLRARDVRIGLASSSRNARTILEKAELLSCFDSIFDGVEAEVGAVRSKPHPDFYRAAASALGREPSDCLVFEDAVSGVDSAKQAGCRPIVGVVRLGHKPEPLRAAGADHTFDSLTHPNLAAIIEEFLGGRR